MIRTASKLLSRVKDVEGPWELFATVCPMARVCGSLWYDRRTIFWTIAHKITQDYLQTESKQLQPQVSRSYVAAVAEESALCRMEGLMTASLLFNLFAKMFDWRTTTNLNILGRQTLQHSSWAQGPQLETVLKWAYICLSGALYTGRYFLSVAQSD